MAYVTPGTVAAGDVATAAAWNVLTNDVIDHETRILKTGLVLVSSTTFSASTAFNVDSVFTSTYENYRIILGVSSTAMAGAQNVTARMRASGTSYSGATYNYGRNLTNFDATQSLAGAFATTSWLPFALSNGTDASSQPAYGVYDIFAPRLSAWTQFSGTYMYINQLAAGQSSGGLINGQVQQTTQYDGIGFTTTNAVSGTIRIYGYLNS